MVHYAFRGGELPSAARSVSWSTFDISGFKSYAHTLKVNHGRPTPEARLPPVTMAVFLQPAGLVLLSCSAGTRPKCSRDLLNPRHVSHRIFPPTPTTISRKPSVIYPVHQPPHGRCTDSSHAASRPPSLASLNCLINSLKRQPSAIIGSEAAGSELHSPHSVSDCI